MEGLAGLLLVPLVWGIGLSMKNELRHDPNNWQGTNWLGEVLTNLRNNIAAKSKMIRH
jgi:predicted NAD-dependent protein-ADP-ribosyltransferase YbiA (DUF1768 family)